MLPEGARRVSNEGLEASGAPLGAMWAQSGRQERSKWLLGAARAAKRNHWLDPGPPQRRKVDRFQGPGGVAGGLWGGLRGGIFGLFSTTRRGEQKTMEIYIYIYN